ncbi:MAG: NUDIX hydrolase [Candidatus Iainarchaeum archaeon]|uniref:NUDIX hydrolase n=1 Tax=Candidatus Iainarchaeum sp. TaxID=3101447 RepID=A0A7T9DJC5_9ARCH|nr:MAG: NUDIX hydrolase [Candidatus Diapherotrites archaeon]
MQTPVMGKLRGKIFQQFVYAQTLRFSELHARTKIGSNLLAYYLNGMIKKGLLEKSVNGYKLTLAAEKYLPFFVPNQESISPLVVVLIACVSDGDILLLQRNKRPYQGLWSLVSGRLLITESLSDAIKRIMREKAEVEVDAHRFVSITYERLLEKGNYQHGFLLMTALVTPKTLVKEKSYLKWFPLAKLPKRKIIASDYWIIQNKLQESVPITEEIIHPKKKMTIMQLLKEK